MDLDIKDYNNRTVIKEDNSTSSTSSNFPVWEDYNSSVDDIRYFLIGLYTFVSLLGFVGNLLILLVLFRKRKQKTIINFLIGNLAFSDILVVLFCSPFTLTCVLLDQWIFGEILCHIVPFLQCVSVLISTLMLISIAVVRYHMIKNPLSTILTANHGYFLIATVWTLGFTICSPLPVFHKIIDLSETFHLESLNNRYLCIESWPSDSYRIAFTISLLLVQYILPIIFLIISYTNVCKSISSRLPNRENRFEENEMINLTLQQPKKTQSQMESSGTRKWSYSFVKKHRRRYSKKSASVVPAILRRHQDSTLGEEVPETSTTDRSHTLPSSVFLPGVPICFEMKTEESLELQNVMCASKSITRIKKRSRRVFCRLTVLILAFSISWMPLHLFHLVTDFNANLISNRHFKLVFCICHLLGMMSCCLNPLLYGFLNNGIKDDLMSLIQCFQIS
ncbi:neuropeptide Y receptor type 5 [Rhinatrema bivittatum]|uniref:neuropeptide Y receptor type 5 n=1 Tax=Rhinatrema bivittatum TaxID=194408 RepID=UPI00112A22BC|nr:neuropeptide Y receptor type 5 [Rhinatrema bivittatum]XP_029474663.1 neuropeptide Y receptor type 5 [Rhinatrema bivittatum]